MNKVDGLCDSEFYIECSRCTRYKKDWEHAGPTFVGNGKIQRQIFHVACVIFEKDKSLVKIGIQGRKIIEEALLSEPLR